MKTQAILMIVAMTVGACSDDDGKTPKVDSGAVDGTMAKDGAADSELYPDLGLPPDLGKKVECESEWIDALSAQETVSKGEVVTTESNGVKVTTLDASAGGSSTGATKHPFVYLSLADGKRVDINDKESRNSTAWDIAFRRTVIRINGGDSGPGQGGVMVIQASSLDAVTAEPAGATYLQDDFLDGDCNIARDAISQVETSFSNTTGNNGWYDYAGGGVTPKKQVYLIKRADGSSLVKLMIDSYEVVAGTSGTFSLSWAAL